MKIAILIVFFDAKGLLQNKSVVTERQAVNDTFYLEMVND